MDKYVALDSWREEKSSAFLYHFAATAEKGTPQETLFLQLAEAAESQADFWAKSLTAAGIPIPVYKPNFRTRFVAWLILRMGVQRLKTVLAAMKVRGLSTYLGDVPGHPAPRKKAGKIFEHQHRAIENGSNLRAAVFGVNDGLVSNASLILGVAGASNNAHFIILSGVAGLIAGAISMAAGEYISMRSQRELYEYQINLERAELEKYPEEEALELSYIYQARGLSKDDADDFAKRVLSDKENALHTLAREELGLNPNELGSPWGAAISSFFAFATGSFIPILPFLLQMNQNHIQSNLVFSILLSGLALFGVGIMLSLFTGRNAFISGLRMLAIGGFAGLVTFAIGKIIGVNIN